MAALHEELLDLAALLATEPQPKAAVLRRAISTAYYALFHLLIFETTLNWGIEDQRQALARAFDHGPMKQACERRSADARRLLKDSLPPSKRTVEEAIAFVADAFVRLQEHRHAADYDVSGEWAKTDAVELVDSVIEAFERWRQVRETPEAQDFLLSLLVKKR